MEFSNYLSKLADANRIKEEICIYGCSDIINDIYLEIKRSRNRGSISFIKERLGIPYQTLYCWVCGSNPIPISKSFALVNLWKEVCKKNDFDVKRKIESLYLKVTHYSQNGQRKVKLPKQLDCELGYLIGFFQGDGHLKKRTIQGFQEYSVYFYEARKIFLNHLNKILYNKFGVKGNIYFQKNQTGRWYTLRISSKSIYLFFREVLGLNSGRKVREVSVPKIINDSEDQIQISFIRGFFDAEGGVGETVKNPWLEIGQAGNNPPEILMWIKERLAKEGIYLSNLQKSSRQDFFRIRTSKRETIKRFYDVVNSNHPKKLNRMISIINR